jgi:hypothetical protein
LQARLEAEDIDFSLIQIINPINLSMAKPGADAAFSTQHDQEF